MRLILTPIYPTLETSFYDPVTQEATLGILVMFALAQAGVAELADARDSKSRDLHWSCGFDPHLQHHRVIYNLADTTCFRATLDQRPSQASRVVRKTSFRFGCGI